MRIVCISDTHTFHDKLELPDGDVLVHAGDFSFHGYSHEVKPFSRWLQSLPYKHIIVIAGNHDTIFEDNYRQGMSWLMEPRKKEGIIEDTSNIHYLQDTAITLEVDGVSAKFYGSPWQPEFCNWAFNATEDQLEAIWKNIPKDTDVLVTHGPPYGYGDQLSELGSAPGMHVGSRALKAALQRVRPKLHVFGHIHEGYGTYEWNNMLLVNASSCTPRYKPINEPIVVEIDANGNIKEM